MRPWFPRVTGLAAFRAGPRLQAMTVLPQGDDQPSSLRPLLPAHPTAWVFGGGKRRACGWNPEAATTAPPPSLPPQDMRAHTSIPLLGYQVTTGPQADPRVFQLQQSGQLYTFKAESEELKGRWVKAMERAASGWSPGGPGDKDLSD